MKTIYEFIRDIILDNEANAKDEFYWLDQVFGWMPF